MKAVGYFTPQPIDHADALLDLDLPTPTPGAHDLLVRVKAVSVNPVDVKVRASATPKDGSARILGWDAVGVVEGMGADVQGFAVGDRVYYAGDLTRPGTNAELHAVDARIAAHAPKTLNDAEAAALPLTSITAWELLFDRLAVPAGGGQGQTLLVMGGAGGVGSMLTQLARELTELRVVATASRPETRAWSLDHGAHDVIDHRQPLAPQLAALGLPQIDLVAGLTHTPHYFAQYVDCLRPQGRIALIDDMDTLNVVPLKAKSLSLHWEMMFTRSMFGTADMARQGALLAEVAQLADAGRIRSTLTEEFGPLNAANLRRAHARVESGKMIGKAVLAGF
ncbi:zinc-binding alcohol dehydrogenase family protein [Ottowia sp. GY511]|uniref:Zinc-type alcohol dehydrogenase-like protein n=1 Tax=Ottowia flava TaxID=2675430 RepID=A0ABW4KZP8_9BURK|nr:zinc-binding alcohol dehydrogenase family protein [Ottowia sp. GY511]TXK24774.1 zinc-binding alcohol dehydrogenase family protein [Ottowia sp. GY511]